MCVNLVAIKMSHGTDAPFMFKILEVWIIINIYQSYLEINNIDFVPCQYLYIFVYLINLIRLVT